MKIRILPYGDEHRCFVVHHLSVDGSRVEFDVFDGGIVDGRVFYEKPGSSDLFEPPEFSTLSLDGLERSEGRDPSSMGEAILTGSVKSSFCSDWRMPSERFMHFCGPHAIVHYSDMWRELYNIAQGIFGDERSSYPIERTPWSKDECDVFGHTLEVVGKTRYCARGCSLIGDAP